VREQGKHWGSDDQRRRQLNAVMARTSRHQPFGLEQRIQLSQFRRMRPPWIRHTVLRVTTFHPMTIFTVEVKQIPRAMKPPWMSITPMTVKQLLWIYCKVLAAMRHCHTTITMVTVLFIIVEWTMRRKCCKEEEVSSKLKNPGSSYLRSPKVSMIYDNTVLPSRDFTPCLL
jgi:hypothetical protein